MKVFGSSGRRTEKRKDRERRAVPENPRKRRGAGRRVLKAMIVFLVILLVLLGGAYAAFMLWITPPTIENIEPPRPLPGSDNNESAGGGRQGGLNHGTRERVFSILLAGEDDDFGGTDVIMLILFDTDNGTLDVLSIPRDTVVNVPWGVKKINSIMNMYTQLGGNYDHYIDALADEVAKLVGFRPNNWVTLDLYGFIALVDALPDGGVYFNVPVRMWYSDPYQDLFIDLQPGYQLLTGNQAMQVVRFRNYTQADIQRIRVQHDFLRALSDQLLQPSTILVADNLIRIFMDNVETDLSLANVGWFAHQFLSLDRENIRFHSVDDTIANIDDSVNGISYVTLHVEPWLQLINEYFNPFTWEIYAEDLEILTRNPATGAFFTTSGTPYLNFWSP